MMEHRNSHPEPLKVQPASENLISDLTSQTPCRVFTAQDCNIPQDGLDCFAMWHSEETAWGVTSICQTGHRHPLSLCISPSGHRAPVGWRLSGGAGGLTRKTSQKKKCYQNKTLLPATCPRLEEPQDRAAQGAGPSAGQTALAACGIDLDIDQMPLV